METDGSGLGGAVSITFVVGDEEDPATVGGRQILHEAFRQALPERLTVGHRLTFRAPNGDELFADQFVGEIVGRYPSARIATTATAIPAKSGRWRNIGFDHLAITVADRPAARDFFAQVLGLRVMRDDEHLTVVATGLSALFLFDAGDDAPLSTGELSRWHHLGFVVDDLEAAYADLRRHGDRLQSDFVLLERDERWSLYCFYRNGDVTFMIQLSEIKAGARGFADPVRADTADFLYDYVSRPYGVSLAASGGADGDGGRPPEDGR